MFFAGIVLYNPNMNRLIENIISIKNQVDCIVCVDNNSNNYKEIKDKFGNDINIILISNFENKGIGYALNQIVRWGIKHDYQWVLTLDQDSICPPDIIEKYTEYINEKIGIISPLINDINKKDLCIRKREEIDYIGDCNAVITSGGLVNIKIWEDIGGFNEKLFIDFIDIEYNKRLLINKYKILRVNSVILTHEIGNIKEIKLGNFKIICTNHNAFRRYYMVRNRLFFMQKYCSRNEYYLAKVKLILGTIKIATFEIDKINKIKATIRGFRDYKNIL